MSFKKILPHAIGVALFLLISLVYFAPLLDGKKQIRQSDISQHKATAEEISVFRSEHPGEEPLWTGSMFAGMPAFQVSALYPNNLMRYVDQVFLLFLPFPVAYLFLYFIGFYILLLCLRIDPRLAVIGSLAYGFSSFFFIILEVGHNTQAHAIGYMAPLLGAVVLTYRGDRIAGGALLALFTALELYCNHVQITYYLFMIVLTFVLVEFYAALKEKKAVDFLKRSFIMVTAVIIGVLPNITGLWTTYEYGKYSTRGVTELTIAPGGAVNTEAVSNGLDKAYATQWSYGPGETFTLLIPDFKGGASDPLATNKKALEKITDPQMRRFAGAVTTTYFGDQDFTSGPVYAGAIVCFLAVLGMLFISDRIKWALMIITLVAILLSWGKNFMGFSSIFFDYFPGYNKFRAVSMILVIAELTLPLLAVLGLRQVMQMQQGTVIRLFRSTITAKKILVLTSLAVGGFCLLCWLAPTLFTTFSPANEPGVILSRVRNPSFSSEQARAVIEQAEEARKYIFTSDAIRSLVFILLAALGLGLYLYKKISVNVFLAALGIFILADMWPVALRYLDKEDYATKAQNQAVFAKTKADELILQDTSSDYRVLNLSVNPFMDGLTSYWHRSIGGYHGAKLKNYQELTEFYISENIHTLSAELNKNGISDSVLVKAFSRAQVLNMLNTKYVIHDPAQPPLKNPLANGNAWFVKEIRYANTVNEEMMELGEINTKNVAVMNVKFKTDLTMLDPGKDTRATIQLLSYAPNKLLYESNSSTEQLALFSEIYYPKGWIALIDGKETAILKANYVLRALRIPAGKHNIEFAFKPRSYYVGEKIALAGSLLVLLIAVSGIFFSFRKYRNKKTIR